MTTEINHSKKKGEKFHFESWGTMESSFEEELKRIWEPLSGTIFEKLEILSHELKVWSAGIKLKKNEVEMGTYTQIGSIEGGG